MAHQTSGSFHIVSQGTAQICPCSLSDSFPAGNSLEETKHKQGITCGLYRAMDFKVTQLKCITRNFG